MSWKPNDKAYCWKSPAGAWLTGQVPEDAMATFPKGIPVRGETYTVRTIECWDGRVALTLKEKPTVGVGGVDEGWAEYLFRKPESAEHQRHVTQEASL